ncbi:MAG: hypothetical protein KAI64_06340, partial [Thermoplasmata archaeon]|nr:hypothetical protein [Thermoplasmata archaeon]
MRRQTGAIILVGMLLVGIFPSIVVGAPGDYHVLEVYFQDKEYDIGEQVNLTAHVWNNAIYTSVDNVTGWIIDFSIWPPIIVRQINFTESATSGIYDANFTIQSGDVSIMNGSLNPTLVGHMILINFIAVVGASTVADIVSFVFVDKPPDINTKVSDNSPRPGDTVDIDVTVKNSTYVDANALNVTVYNFTTSPPQLYDDGVRNITGGEDLIWSQTSQGNYTAQYTVPSNLKNSTIFIILCNASFEDYSNIEPFSQMFFPARFVVDFYQVYYHNVSQNDTQSIFEIYVTDLDGKIIEGATLNTFFTYDNGTVDFLTKQTDAGGKATYYFNYSTSTESIYVRGWANYSGYSQYIGNTSVYEKDIIEPMGDEFEVVFHTGGFFDFYNRGDTVTWNYTAFNNSLPLASEKIMYWI